MNPILCAVMEGNFFSTSKSRDCVITAANTAGDVFLKALTACEDQVPALESFLRRMTTVKDDESSQKALREEITKHGDAFSTKYLALLDGGDSPYKIGQKVFEAASKNKADLKRPEVAEAYNQAIIRFKAGDVKQKMDEVVKKFSGLNDSVRNAEDKLSGVGTERHKTLDVIRSLYLFVQRRLNNLEAAITTLARG